MNFKNWCLSIVLLLGFQSASQVYAQQRVDFEVSSATVFLNGAQLTGKNKVNYKKGNNTIQIKGVSPYINPQSLMVKTKGDFVLLDARYFVEYPKTSGETAKVPKEVIDERDDLVRAITFIDYDLNLLESQRTDLVKEKEFINKYNLINSTGKRSDSLPMFKAGMDYYRQRADDVNNRYVESQKKTYDLTLVRKNKDTKLRELNNYISNFNVVVAATPMHLVELNVLADSDGAGEVVLSFLANNASWTPSYDLRTGKAVDKINFTYKAHVVQNTGINWKDAMITISTSNPKLNNNRPILNPQNITFLPLNVYRDKKLRDDNAGYLTNTYAAPVAAQEIAASRVRRESLDEEKDMNNFRPVAIATTNEGSLNVEFEVKYKQDIPSDGQQHTVIVNNQDVATNYRYHSVPKLDKGAFLLARIVDWGVLNLLPGNANLFIDDAYIGQSFIDPNLVVDTLLISLGRDEKVTIKREKMECSTTTNLLKTKVTQTHTYEITVRNNRSTDIELDLLDQIPITGEEEIKIELIEAKDAEYVKELGKILWNIKLKPSEVRKVKLRYSVTFPKDKPVQGL